MPRKGPFFRKETTVPPSLAIRVESSTMQNVTTPTSAREIDPSMFVVVSMSSASSTSSSTSERKIVDNLKVYDDISKY
ncbi:hypothetical protein GE061_005883 [Apolygus lucorum]|uniref:Uncharacterized protein n=1 Tax=Apolygus lucorum TaxID=248454 RepID=A0A8S9X1H5_APOLU|nr:hypothetical protein GE061_005883 [Apolygus lucorum]